MIINKNNNNNNNKKVDLLMRHVAMRVLQQRDGDEEKIHNQVRHKVPAKHSGKRSEINPCCQDWTYWKEYERIDDDGDWMTK